MSALRVAVIGAGLSGLAAARRAQQAGQPVRVFEASGQAGGVVQTTRRDGWLIEHGPNTIQETPAVAGLIRELGLAEERVEAGERTRNRYVWRGGQLVPLPLSPPRFLAGSFFSTGTKLKILREFWSGRRPAPDSDPAFADFIREHFGEEALCYAAQPFVSGTYAGDPYRLSARYAFPRLWQSALDHGSILKGQIAAGKARRAAGHAGSPPLVSFKNGLAALPAALQRSLPPQTITFGAHISGLRRVGSAWELTAAEPIAGPNQFDRVIVTSPAKVAGAMDVDLGAGAVQPFRFLDAIAHPPVTALFAGFRSAAIKHALDGFGCLVPSIENRSILGILFSSSLFPGRAPDGCSALTIMLGGSLQPGHARRTALEAWAIARTDVEAMLGIAEHPVFLEATHYPQAIPQYDVGYGSVGAEIEAAEAAYPGLSLSGNYRGGISVPDRLIGR